MQENQESKFQFNLLKQPWIGLEKTNGEIEASGIEFTLLHAQDYRGIYNTSPLVVVGVHRLLVVILQQIFNPVKENELRKLWQIEKIPPDLVNDFIGKYGDRFDLFSAEKPFYQSADVSQTPVKGSNIKSIAYLAPDIPTGTEVTHYHHQGQASQVFCPACVASLLVCLPAFSTSGGQGIKPSINGVPPIYVLPYGGNLLQSLLMSLVLPDFQPEVRSKSKDLVWWDRDPIIPQKSEIVSVGYLHSLTFQARRVRLYPEEMKEDCSRCGKTGEIGVRKMIFDMGEWRAKDAPFWFDPFAAYHLREKKTPVPIRPQEGKAIWREYGSFFLKPKETECNGKGKVPEKTLRPRLLDQISILTEGELGEISLRCIGLRTDMKAKVFEWIDTGFEVPTDLLRDEEAGYQIENGLNFSREAASTISSVFRKVFGGSSQKQGRYAQLKSEMIEKYWLTLAIPFREFVLSMAVKKDREKTYFNWVTRVVREANQAFSDAASEIGDEGAQLKLRFQAEKRCRIYLAAKLRNEVSND